MRHGCHQRRRSPGGQKFYQQSSGDAKETNKYVDRGIRKTRNKIICTLLQKVDALLLPRPSGRGKAQVIKKLTHFSLARSSLFNNK